MVSWVQENRVKEEGGWEQDDRLSVQRPRIPQWWDDTKLLLPIKHPKTPGRPGISDTMKVCGAESSVYAGEVPLEPHWMETPSKHTHTIKHTHRRGNNLIWSHPYILKSTFLHALHLCPSSLDRLAAISTCTEEEKAKKRGQLKDLDTAADWGGLKGSAVRDNAKARSWQIGAASRSNRGEQMTA